MTGPRTGRLVTAAIGEVAVFAAGVSAIVGLHPALYFLHSTGFDVVLIPSIGIVVGLLAAIRFRRWFLATSDEPQQPAASSSAIRQLSRRSRSVRWALALAIVTYLATWMVGVPVVMSDAAIQDLRANERAAEYSGTTLSTVYSVSHFAMPVTPGIIILYHEHWGGQLHGWGGWKLYFWYGYGHRELYESVDYVSTGYSE